MDSTQQPKKYTVQGKALGGFEDMHTFVDKGDAETYVRNLVEDWAEDPADFRIVPANTGGN